jgi:hypothetical protein
MHKIFITNLASHNVIMKGVQNLFIHNSYISRICALKIHLTHGFIGRCEIHVTFVHSKVCTSFINTYIHVLNLCSTYDIVYMCKMSKLINEQILQDFHY